MELGKETMDLLSGLGWPEQSLGQAGSVSYVPEEMTESFCNAVVRFDGIKEIVARAMSVKSGRLVPFAKLSWTVKFGSPKAGVFELNGKATCEVEAMAAYQAAMGRCTPKPNVRLEAKTTEKTS